MGCAAFNFEEVCLHCLGFDFFFVADVVPLLVCLIDQRKIVHAACFHYITCIFYFLWRCGPTRARASSFLRFLDHTQRRATFGRTPLYE